MTDIIIPLQTQLHTIGATYQPNGSEFIVWSPETKTMELLIELQSMEEDPAQDGSIFYHDGRPYRAYPMMVDGLGYWQLRLPVPARSRYFFRLDGKIICPDPASFSQPRGVHGPSELCERHSFTWTDDSWKGLPLSEMILYELHTGCFSPTHDFQGVIDRLDHLVHLGVNAIEVMPIAQFAGDRNWGYDGVYPFAIQSSYGGVDGFRKLVDAAHRRGIAVIVDVVYNHFGPEGCFLQHFAPYFTDKYRTPWGMAVNFDDAWSDGVRNFLLQHARMLLEYLRVDGLRLDAVHAIKDFGACHFMEELKTLALEIGQRTGRHKLVIAELDLNDPKYINPATKGGYRLDGQWVDEFHHALRAYITGESYAWLQDFGRLEQLGKAFTHTYVYDGIYSPHRRRTFGGKALQNPYHQFIVFAQNHDQIGNRAEGDRLSAQLSFDQLKLVAATVLLSPYVPLLFMGEEYGEENPFRYFVSFADPELIGNVRQGRKREFAGFIKEQEIPDPQSEETFLQSNLSWDFSSGNRAALLDFYRQLIAFRKTRPAMRNTARNGLRMHKCKGGLICMQRTLSSDSIYVCLNFNRHPLVLPNDSCGGLRKVLDSAAEAISPGKDPGEIVPVGGDLHLPPHSCTVFEVISQ
jgi:maltooligosyltrehalose trehalohydrolase